MNKTMFLINLYFIFRDYPPSDIKTVGRPKDKRFKCAFEKKIVNKKDWNRIMKK